jgi:hypothetical protein
MNGRVSAPSRGDASHLCQHCSDHSQSQRFGRVENVDIDLGTGAPDASVQVEVHRVRAVHQDFRKLLRPRTTCMYGQISMLYV